MHNGDIYRILNGYDSCGNICGQNNDFTYETCRGTDMTKNKYLRYVQSNRECVENCSQYREFHPVLNRCISDRIEQTGRDFFQEVAHDLTNTWQDIIYMCCIALGFAVVTLLLFKYLACVIVWIVLNGVIIILFATTTLLRVHYERDIRENPDDVTQ